MSKDIIRAYLFPKAHHSVLITKASLDFFFIFLGVIIKVSYDSIGLYALALQIIMLFWIFENHAGPISLDILWSMIVRSYGNNFY